MFVVRKSVVGLRKLIFHVCFEPLGFVDPVKLFGKKNLQASALKPQGNLRPLL